MDIVAYIISSLSILWAFGGGQMELFWTRVLVAGPICLICAILLLRKRKEMAALKPNSSSLMMGVGVGFALFLVGLLLAWFFRDRVADIAEMKTYTLLGLATWVIVLAPACEIIYRKVLGPEWGVKSSAFVEALNFGVGAVNFYLFAVVFLWGFISSKFALRFGLVSTIIARSVATLLLLLSLKAMS